MKYRLINFAAIAASIILSLLFIGAGDAFLPDFSKTVFLVINSLIFRGIGFLTAILLLASLCVASNRLLRSGRFWHLLKYFGLSLLTIYATFLLLAYLLLKLPLLPSGQQLPDISRIQSPLPAFQLSAETWEQVQQASNLFSWLQILAKMGQNANWLVWIALFIALSLVMRRDMEVAEPSYNLADSLSRLSFGLLQSIYAVLGIYLAMFIAFRVWQIRSDVLLPLYLGFFLRLGLLTLLLFIAATLFLFFVYKDKKAWLFGWRIFLTTFASLLSGNAIFSMSVMIVEQKQNRNAQRNTSGLLNPLNLLFLRPGSAIVLAYSFFTYYTGNTRWQLGLLPEVLWFVLLPLVFALLIGIFSIPSYAMVLPFYLVSFGLGASDTFVLIAPILLLGQGFAVCIDALSWNISNYIYDTFYLTSRNGSP